jgi:hypothetical protein
LNFDAIQASLPDPELLDPSKSWRDSVVIGEGVLSTSEALEGSKSVDGLEAQFELGPDKWLPLPDENTDN